MPVEQLTTIYSQHTIYLQRLGATEGLKLNDKNNLQYRLFTRKGTKYEHYLFAYEFKSNNSLPFFTKELLSIIIKLCFIVVLSR